MSKFPGFTPTSLLAAALLACMSASAFANPPELTRASVITIDRERISAKGRPNEEHRLNGLKGYVQQDYRDARRSFQAAAAHADKLSQHYLSLMHWHGVGSPADRALGYVWADLAAERGSRPMLAIRERMWSELDDAERARVTTMGPALYARYGDEAAKPRAEGVMRGFARQMTGSRVGFRNQRLEMYAAPEGGIFYPGVGTNTMDYAIDEAATADALYGPEGGLKRMATYWQAQDQLLQGTITVGPFKQTSGKGRGQAG